MWMVLFVLVLNLGISWLNCWSVGRSWEESKARGGWARVLAWCGAVQAAIGFSSITGAMLLALAHASGRLPPAALHAALSLWYLLIIIPALSTGMVITIESWRAFYRERSWGNGIGAAYNTAAMAHNAYGAVDGIGQALAGVEKLFSGGDEEDGSKLGLLVVGLVLAALLGGVLVTAYLIRYYARRAASALPYEAQPAG